MFGLFKKKKEESYIWQKEHSRLWAALVPAKGQAETLQGELIRIAGKLTDQAFRNGNMNWDTEHEKMWRFVGKHLDDPQTFGEDERKLIRDKIDEIITDYDAPDVSGEGCCYYVHQREGRGLVHGPSEIDPTPKRSSIHSMIRWFNTPGSAGRLGAIAVLLLFTCKSFAVESPLADAAEKSDRAAVRTLLQKRADLNVPQVDGMTALHWAAQLDDLEMARMLLKAGADAKATNHYGVTPLSLACANGNGELVELLLAAGADPNTTLRGGETALMTAARTGKVGPVKALLARGAKVDAKEKRGQTAMMWAAAEGNTEVVELLLKAGADFRTPLPDTGFTPLLFAVREGRPGVVRALLKAGADVNEVTQPRRVTIKTPSKGSTALTLAIENGHFELAMALIEAGADLNDQRSGFAPLHEMTWVRKPPRGEDYGAPPPLGSGNLSSLQFIRKLVAHGADVNARLKTGKGAPAMYNKTGATPFMMASATADIAYMKLLIELGANPRLGNADNCTPLIATCGLVVGSDAANETAGEEPEILEAAQLLLDLGADVNAVDANGETAMHAAAYKNLPKVVQFLADKGAKIEVWNQKNKHGWTPLAIAQGYRPGNFKPSFETIAALQSVMLAAGVTPPTNPPAAKNINIY